VKREVLPLVTQSGGMPPVDPIVEDLRRGRGEGEAAIHQNGNTKGAAESNPTKVKCNVLGVPSVDTSGEGEAPVVKSPTDGVPALTLGVA